MPTASNMDTAELQTHLRQSMKPINATAAAP